ncbi:MAG: protein phosphatase 2C domain-containing protein [Pseudomonadota bacterium]
MSLASAWQSAGVTDMGLRRQHNEDAFLDSPDSQLWAVADGMGGHDRGELASAMVCEALGRIRGDSLLDVVDAADDAISSVNTQLLDIASELATEKGGTGLIGCTVVALIAREPLAVCLWAGDSRIYRLRGRVLEQVTEDHSLAAESASASSDSPPVSRNVITRAVGASAELVLDVESLDLQSGDRFLLCSDGLTNELSDEYLRQALSNDSASAVVARQLVDAANHAGGRDNVSALVVDYRDSNDLSV